MCFSIFLKANLTVMLVQMSPCLSAIAVSKNASSSPCINSKHVTVFLRQLYYGTTDPNKQHWDIYRPWSRSFALLGNTENISDVVDRWSQGTRLRECEFVGLHYFVREGISVTSALKIEICMMISQHTCLGKM